MTAFLLDTHVWIWYVNGSDTLKKATRNTITDALHANKAHLAAISLWEICMLDKKQRIILEMPCLEWLNQSIELTHIQVVPLTPAITHESCYLPGKIHEDPADRMIVATARVGGLTLITRDSNILNYSKGKYLSAMRA